MRSRGLQAAPMIRRRNRQRRSPAGRIRYVCTAVPEEPVAEAVPVLAVEAAVAALVPAAEAARR